MISFSATEVKMVGTLKSIIYNRLPCWYELSFDSNRTALILRVHQDFIDEIGLVMPNQRFIDSFLQDFGFATYCNSLDFDFGFDCCCHYEGVDKDRFTNFVIPIPQIVVFSDKVCPDCKGTGKDPKRSYQYNRCLACRGTGKKRNDNDWHLAKAISATLFFFFLRAGLAENETSARIPQLMTIHTVCLNQTQHAGELGGELSIPLMNWLKYFENDQIFTTVIDSMRRAYYAMFGETAVERCEVRAYMHDHGRLSIDCPGDRTGIFICCTESLKPEKGNEFMSHNVDTCAQQLTLLVGLASLCDLARHDPIYHKLDDPSSFIYSQKTDLLRRTRLFRS